jgi:hypothetical protein
MKRLVVAALVWLSILISPALCGDSIVGTWKIQSFVREVVASGRLTRIWPDGIFGNDNGRRYR